MLRKQAEERQYQQQYEQAQDPDPPPRRNWFDRYYRPAAAGYRAPAPRSGRGLTPNAARSVLAHCRALPVCPTPSRALPAFTWAPPPARRGGPVAAASRLFRRLGFQTAARGTISGIWPNRTPMQKPPIG